MSETLREALAKRVETAFRDTSCPTDDIFHYPDNWEHNVNDFKGKHWRDIPLNLLIQHRDKLVSLTDASFHFYLPAYLRAAILHPDDVDTLIDNLVLNLTPPIRIDKKLNDFLQKTELFDMEQKDVIATYFESFLELYPEFAISYSNERDLHDLGRAVTFWRSTKSS